jgi:hypothetical protein
LAKARDQQIFEAVCNCRVTAGMADEYIEHIDSAAQKPGNLIWFSLPLRYNFFLFDHTVHKKLHWL